MGISKETAYEILELPYGADQDSIRTSYKRLALKWHPDKHENSAQATQKFQTISKAYKRLTDSEDEEEVCMSMADMFDLFQQIVLARAMAGSFNGYGMYGDYRYDSYEDIEDDDEDYYDSEDYDEENVDFLSIFEDKLRRKQEYRKPNSDISSSTKRQLTPEEIRQIEKNASELITEEEKEKRKAEKRRAKKKRQREKKKLEKQESEQQKKEALQKNATKQEISINNDIKQKTNKKDKKSKDSSHSEEEDFDQNAAFFTKVKNKRKKGINVVPENPPVHKSNKVKEKPTNQTTPEEPKSNGKDEDETEELDPVVLRSRQLAIRGNEMANSGNYNPAIELFTEAIKLDPSDFRFFGNRSYCFDRNQKYEKALTDAEKAIMLAPEWPKGYFRKGRALAGLKKYAEAEQAFLQVLKLDRQCEDAMQELLRVRICQLTEMGFSKQQAESALRQYGTVQQALDSLLAGVVADNTLNSEVYLSDDDEFRTSVNSSSRVQNLHHQPLPTPVNHTNSTVATASAGTVKMDPKNPEGLTALWVGNVLPEVSEKKLTQMFSKFGPVSSIRLLPEKFCAFVNFKSKEGAGKAMCMLQGQECCGQRLLIKFPDNPITNGNVVIRKSASSTSTVSNTSTNKTTKPSHPTAASISSGALVSGTETILDKQSGPVNGDECYFWRTTGCIYGNKCRWKHRPEHKGVDRKPWQKVK